MPTPDLPSPIVLEEIFRVVAELPVEDRTAYLNVACDGQPEVRARIERMLEVGGIAALLQQGANETVPAEIEKELERLKPEEGGDRIGNYRLLQQIGAGGFGIVWMAEQLEPVRRRVALKIIKLGMDTKEVIARFEQERQSLAMMDHPNIAKVHDAGATPTGRPFFVMELVRGIKITDYCDQANLPTDDRLELFIAVCHAVQHAHQKGIIHRDIKPSNILVTLHDGVPVPKVIDFGVAKATQSQRLTDLTLFTHFEQMIGTPLYMSPEQAEMSGLDIDTRSDIYSLGVLLYELLTGCTPFDPEELMRKGYDEIRRAIREQEPQKPSTALSTMAMETRATVALHRQADSAKLIGQIRGDLDWIVMKALEKDRTRRYETASAFAMDVRRFLADEPVTAAAPSPGYRFRKFARRNKAALIVAGAITGILVAATVFSAWQAIRATKERDAKDVARQDAEAISGFITEVFQSPDPERSGRLVTVAETLDRAVQKLDSLDGHPERRIKLEATLGWTYHKLGLDLDAIPLLEKVRDYFLAASGAESPETIRAMSLLAAAYRDVMRKEDAIRLQEQVLSFHRRRSGPEHPDTLGAITFLASLYYEANRRDESLKLKEEVLALSRRVFGPDHPRTITNLDNLALSYSATERWREALPMTEEVLAQSRRIMGREHPDTLRVMMNLSHRYEEAGRSGEALELREEALVLYTKVHGPEYQGTLWVASEVAKSYHMAGRYEEALQRREEIAARYAKALGPDNPSTHWSRANLAESYLHAGRVEEALALWAPAAVHRPDLKNLPLIVAALQVWFGKNDDHAAFCRRILERDKATHVAGVATMAARLCLLRPMTDTLLIEEALTLARRSVELGQTGKNLCWYHMTHGMAEYRRGNYKAACEALTVAEQRRADKGVWRPAVVAGTARVFQAMCHFQQGDNEAARKLLATAEAEMKPLPSTDRQPLAGDADHDDLVLWLAWKEAKALLRD